MNGFWKLLLSLSLSGSLLALPLLVLCRLTGNRLSQAWRYYVWLLVAVRLLIPLTPPQSAMERLFAHPPAPAALTDVSARANAAGTTGEMAEGEAREKSMDVKAVPLPLSVWAAGLWSAAALALLARKLFAYARFHRFLRAGRRPAAAAELLRAHGDACRALRIRRAVPLYVHPLARSPQLAGMLRPFVVVPDERIGYAAAYGVLLHELTHLKRRDLWYKWLVQLAACVHWFNPLVYVMQREVDRRCELSCDEAVVRLLDTEGRRSYGDALLGTVRPGEDSASPVLSVTLSANAHLIKERLESIMQYRKRSRLHAALSLLLCAVLAAAGVLCGCALPVNAQGAGEKESGRDGFSTINTVFFEDGYVLGIAWNYDFARFGAYQKRDIEAGGVTYPLYFSKGMEKWAKDEAILKAAAAAIAKKAPTARPKLTSPILTSVDGPFEGTPDELATRFYDEKNIHCFAAVVKISSRETCEMLVERAYSDDNVAMLSLAEPYIGEPKRAQFVERAYTDEKQAMFSILFDSDGAEAAKLAERAYADGKIAAFSLLVSNLTKADIEEFAQRAYDDGNITFFSVLSDYLSEEELSRFERSAFADRKGTFLAMLLNGE